MSAGGSATHILCFRWLGAWPPDPICLRWLGIRPQTPTTPPFYCRFLATGLREEKFTARYCRPRFGFNMPGTFDEDVLIHKRCIIRPKVFHPVILIQKNYLKKTFHLHQLHFGFDRDEVFFSSTLYALLISCKRKITATSFLYKIFELKTRFCLLKFLGATSLETPEINFYKTRPLLEPPKLNLPKNKLFNCFS